jgi:hypothetical protein
MVTTKVKLDYRRLHPSDLYFIKVEVSFNRISKFYVLYEKRKITPYEFDRIMNSRKRAKEENTIYKEIQQKSQKTGVVYRTTSGI